MVRRIGASTSGACASVMILVGSLAVPGDGAAQTHGADTSVAESAPESVAPRDDGAPSVVATAAATTVHIPTVALAPTPQRSTVEIRNTTSTSLCYAEVTDTEGSVYVVADDRDPIPPHTARRIPIQPGETIAYAQTCSGQEVINSLASIDGAGWFRTGRVVPWFPVRLDIAAMGVLSRVQAQARGVHDGFVVGGGVELAASVALGPDGLGLGLVISAAYGATLGATSSETYQVLGFVGLANVITGTIIGFGAGYVAETPMLIIGTRSLLFDVGDFQLLSEYCIGVQPIEQGGTYVAYGIGISYTLR